jgi:hypothetical protein
MRIGAERVLAVLEDPCGAIEPFGRRELEMYRLAGERAKTGGDEQEPGEQLRAPTRTEGINLRGVFSFPIEQYAEQLAPVTHGSEIRACRSLVGAKSAPRNTPSATNRTPNPINLLQMSTPKFPRKTASRHRHFWH